MERWKIADPQRQAEETARLAQALKEADAVMIGAGAGLSAAAGFLYSGERFEQYFADFRSKYGIRDMYSGGFYPFPTPEEQWGWWARSIYINRYRPAPKDTYRKLLDQVQGKDYFVLTTNVDHQFQQAGFDKQRLFYTQGDYGLWQCSEPCHQATYDNEETVVRMLLSSGFLERTEHGDEITEASRWRTSVDPALVPHCPVCGKPMTMNLRIDDTFVEDAGWHAADRRCERFLEEHRGQKVLFLELGTGMNTPTIIKFAFWKQAERSQNAVYACVNLGDAFAPARLGERAICLDGDIDAVLDRL